MNRRIVLASLVLAACRPHIDEVQGPEAAAEPAQPSSSPLNVCWIETAKFGPATASALVLRHPQGDVLLDAGNSIHFAEEIQVYDRSTRRYLRWRPGLLVPDEPVSQRLSSAGVDPNRLRWFLPTHAHIDHVGGYLDLPATEVLLHPAEIDLVERGSEATTFEVVPAHARALREHTVALTFEDEPYAAFDRHVDLFGDGSVVVVPLGGHTAGSVGVFITAADGRRILHIGDAANNRREIERNLGKHPSMQRTDSDRERAHDTVATLHALAKADPDLAMIPAHDRAAYQAVFDEPARTCPAPG
jgi:glyoxylase-like metal-dependent hydrolase (beta-lactamase superfamily II)